MTQPDLGPPERSYGCSFGCGRPYDYIMISVALGETQMLCIVCFLSLTRDMLASMVNPNDPEVLKAIAVFNAASGEQVPGPSGKPGRRNAPANSADSDLYDAYDDILTTEDLPEDFR